MCMALLSSCHIYRNYQRPEGLPVDSLFRETDSSRTEDFLILGDLPWQEMFPGHTVAKPDPLRTGEQY